MIKLLYKQAIEASVDHPLPNDSKSSIGDDTFNLYY